MSTKTDAMPLERKWHWPLQDFFGDRRVRNGIKVALAGLSALLVTQLLRLPHDSWAILTVVVMTTSQYVGSMALKAVMRITGTIAGAIIGVWLVGDYTSTPAIFLPLLFLVMAISSYKFGQVGARQVPYAYFLVGLTTLTVVTNGLPTPDQAWYMGLTRTEEILVGAMCALLVMTIVWPRYAREEFIDASRAALKTIDDFVAVETAAYAEGKLAPQGIAEIRVEFSRRLTVLRNLINAGSRESAFFSSRVSNYNAFLVSLISLFHGALYLAEKRIVDLPIVELLRDELAKVSSAVAEEARILQAFTRPGEKLRPSSLNETFDELERKVLQIRTEGFLKAQPLEATMAFAGHFAALQSLRDEFNNIRATIEGLPRKGQPLPEAKPAWDLLPRIDWFWVKVGIKGALSSTIAVILLKWINPPGPAALTLMAWVITLFGRPYIRAGGTGDLRAFRNAFIGSLGLIACVIVLFLTTPFLASYLVMNLVLFALLFTLGFFMAQAAGITFWIQLSFLTISTFVGLDPQRPVPSLTIIETFLGMIVGLAIATVVGRLFWPTLPQTLLKDDLLTLFKDTNAVLRREPDQERIQTRLAILSVEALQAVRQIRSHRFSDEERARVIALVHMLQAVPVWIRHLFWYRRLLPEVTEEFLGPPLQQIEAEFSQMLYAFLEAFRKNDFQRDFPVLNGALAEIDHTVERIRDRGILDDQPLETPLRMLDLVGRYHVVADGLHECAGLIRGLRMQEYAGDYAL
ncbi:MAG: FUSC family protein [Verrucomicrobia bacterium]|nr:FUSC family protein [Verrucomicrobiota bacterium]